MTAPASPSPARCFAAALAGDWLLERAEERRTIRRRLKEIGR